MVTRRVRTGASYVADPGGGKAIWTPTYEDQDFTGAYTADPGGGKAVWGYSAAEVSSGDGLLLADGSSSILLADGSSLLLRA